MTGCTPCACQYAGMISSRWELQAGAVINRAAIKRAVARK